MRITVLGKSPSWQDAGGACSGYLIEERRHLPCCSTAATACSRKLRRFRDYVDVDAVVISHLHADHFLDLVPYAYALTYAPRQQPVPVDRWPGHRHAGAPAAATRRAARRDDLPPRRRRVGQRGPRRERVRPARVRARPTCSRSARCALRFHEVPHFVPTHARRRARRPTAAGASPTAPTARPNDELVGVRPRHRPADARGDAAAPGARRARAATSRPAEAGEHGRRAGARRLVLTHISDELDEEWARDEAEGVRRPGRGRPRGRGLRALSGQPRNLSLTGPFSGTEARRTAARPEAPWPLGERHAGAGAGAPALQPRHAPRRAGPRRSTPRSRPRDRRRGPTSRRRRP